MGDHVVLFALKVEAGDVEAAQQDLQGLGDVPDGNAQIGCPVAVNFQIQLRFFVVKINAGLTEESCFGNFVPQVLGTLLQLRKVGSLENHLEVFLKAATHGFGEGGDDQGASDFADHPGEHGSPRSRAGDIQSGAFSVRFQTNEHQAEI